MILKLINYINKSKIPIFFSTPLPYAIGTASFQILYSYILSVKKKKNLIIIFPKIFKNLLKYKLCNHELFTKIEFNNNNFFLIKSIEILVQIFFNIYFLIKRLIFLLKKNSSNFNFPSINLELELNEIEKKNIRENFLSKINNIDFSCGENLQINEKYENLCKKKLQNIVDFKKEIICIHVREDGYHNELGRRSYRNSSIKNYEKLIHFFLNTNKFTIVRLGDKNMSKLQINNKNLIDLPSYNFGNKLDLFFIKKCKFYIGCDSGPIDTAWLFNKPVFVTNMYALHTDTYPRGNYDRGILKKMYWKSSMERISIIDFIKLDFSYHNSERTIDDIEFHENTSEEIYENGLEFYENIEKKRYNLSLKQENFNKLLKKSLYENLIKDRNEKEDLLNFFEAKKILELSNYNKGSLSNNYLNINL